MKNTDEENFNSLLAIAESESQEIEIDRSLWIELHSWESEIKKVLKRAELAEQTLNELYSIAGIKSLKQLDEVRHEHGNKTWVPTQILKDKKAKEISQFVDVSLMTVPEPIARAATLLEKEIDLSLMEFDGSEWETNLDRLHDFCDSNFRTFATTPEELQKYHLLKTVCDFLNSEITIGENTAPSFLSILIEKDNGIFKPNRNFVLGANRKQFVN